jgi:hypothetical protein
MHVSVRYLIFAAFNDKIWARTYCFSKHTQLSAFVHHLAARPESLGVIAWLLHCSSLAVCAKGMAGARPRLIVAMDAQAWFPKKHVCLVDGASMPTKNL